jgi:hypothetical protein
VPRLGRLPPRRGLFDTFITKQLFVNLLHSITECVGIQAGSLYISQSERFQGGGACYKRRLDTANLAPGHLVLGIACLIPGQLLSVQARISLAVEVVVANRTNRTEDFWSLLRHGIGVDHSVSGKHLEETV